MTRAYQADIFSPHFVRYFPKCFPVFSGTSPSQALPEPNPSFSDKSPLHGQNVHDQHVFGKLMHYIFGPSSTCEIMRGVHTKGINAFFSGKSALLEVCRRHGLREREVLVCLGISALRALSPSAPAFSALAIHAQSGIASNGRVYRSLAVLECEGYVEKAVIGKGAWDADLWALTGKGAMLVREFSDLAFSGLKL